MVILPVLSLKFFVTHSSLTCLQYLLDQCKLFSYSIDTIASE